MAALKEDRLPVKRFLKASLKQLQNGITTTADTIEAITVSDTSI
jgi:hypothetical protein